MTSRLSRTAKKKLFLLAKIVITFVFLAYVLSMVSFQDIALKTRSINLYYMLFWLCLFFVFIFLGGLNVYFIILALKKLPFCKVFKMFCISLSAGMFTPAYIGELGSTAYLLHKEGIPVSQGLSVISVDKILTIAINGGLFLLGLWLYFPGMKDSVCFFILLALIFPFFCIFFRPVRIFFRIHIVERFFPVSKDYFNAIVGFFLNHMGLLLLNLLCTIIRAFIGAYMIWLGLAALGIHEDVWQVMFVNFVARMVTYLPITINGLGLLEGTAMSLFEQIGITPDATLLSFLFDRIICTLFAVFVIIVVTWRKQHFR